MICGQVVGLEEMERPNRLARTISPNRHSKLVTVDCTTFAGPVHAGIAAAMAAWSTHEGTVVCLVPAARAALFHAESITASAVLIAECVNGSTAIALLRPVPRTLSVRSHRVVLPCLTPIATFS